jgi:hypothetical protein
VYLKRNNGLNLLHNPELIEESGTCNGEEEAYILKKLGGYGSI